MAQGYALQSIYPRNKQRPVEKHLADKTFQTVQRSWCCAEHD